MPTLDGPRRRGQRVGTLVSGAAVALVIGALVVAASGASPTAAARLTASTTSTPASSASASTHGGSTTSDHGASSTTAGRGGTTTNSTSGAPQAAGATGATAKATPATGLTGAGIAHGASGTNAAAAGSSADPGPSTSTTSGAAATNADQPCQGTTPLGLGGNWSCTFDDEFNGATLETSKWVPQVTSTSGYLNGATACYLDTPDTVSVSGGTLNLGVRQVAPFTCSYPGGSFTTSYEAGMVSTYGLFDQTYGAFEVSAKLPAAAVDGLQETMWLYPQDLNAGAGSSPAEIDFAEFFSQYPGLDVPYIHYANSSSDPYVTAYDCSLDQNAFNTYEVDWQPGTITVLYNGKTCLVDHPTTGSAPFDKPFFIALTQALGVGTNAFSAPSTPLPATTQVDWVRAWSPS